MGEVVYLSQVRIEREDGPVRAAYLPVETVPTMYGTHGPVAEHYGQVLKRVHVDYNGVQIPPDKRETADRALSTHQRACPVARSIEGAIAVTTAWADSD